MEMMNDNLYIIKKDARALAEPAVRIACSSSGYDDRMWPCVGRGRGSAADAVVATTSTGRADAPCAGCGTALVRRGWPRSRPGPLLLVLVRRLLLVLLLRRRGVSGVWGRGGAKMIRGGWMGEVLCRVDEGGELVCEVNGLLVVSVHISIDAVLAQPLPPLNQFII